MVLVAMKFGLWKENNVVLHLCSSYQMHFAGFVFWIFWNKRCQILNVQVERSSFSNPSALLFLFGIKLKNLLAKVSIKVSTLLDNPEVKGN